MRNRMIIQEARRMAHVQWGGRRWASYKDLQVRNALVEMWPAQDHVLD